MGNLEKHLNKAFLMMLILHARGETYKYHFNSRQENVCANHNMGEFVENPLDCHLFYWCGEKGQAVSASCPPNMLFNSESKLCDTKANVKCTQTTQTPPASANIPSLNPQLHSAQQYCLNAYEQQPNSNSLIFLAHPTICSQYYMCYYGQALLQECSTDLQWNSRIGKCDLPANVKCQTESHTISLPFAPTELSAIGVNGIVCPTYGQHIFPHMQRCNMFIYCVKGHVILQQCPFYKYFDVESSRCKWRNKSICIKDLNLEYRKNTF